jgi:ubiquinone/menaquinone biosynthesis C-methylase UbiE
MAPGSKITQQEIWNSIAESWRRVRTRMYDDLKEFLRNNTSRNFVLDLGCGSGRNFMAGKKYVGVDFSENMLRYSKQYAKKNGIDAVLIKADLTRLPLKSSTFNTVLLVATLHVLQERATCLEEMKRVMEKGGEALVTVWNKTQPRFFFSKKECYVPWKVSGKIYCRYYYLFSKRELRKLLSEYFSLKRIFGSNEKALKLFPKNIIAVVKK